VFSIEIRSIVSIARRACFILVKGLKSNREALLPSEATKRKV